VTHLTEADVRLFVSGRLERSALQRFVRHLLSGCAECQRKLAPYAPLLAEEEIEPPEQPVAAAEAYDAALGRALAAVESQAALWAEERSDLERLLARARERPYQGSLDIWDDLAEVTHGWAWVEGLLALSFEARYRDPHAMWYLAWGASVSAREIGHAEIDRGRYTPAQLADLRARTLAELANAERLNHHFQEAEHALAGAADALDEGTRDLLIVGRVLDVEASLRMDERRFDEAFALLDLLHHHYIAIGEIHLAGRALISTGIALRRNDRAQEAVAVLREGLSAIDPQRDPKLLSTGQQAYLDALIDAGGYREARELLLESGLRRAFADDPINLLKLRWLEGKIFAGLGKLWRAAAILAEVKEEFLRRDREYLAAMLSLELAGVRLRQGKAAEVEALAEEALEIFHDLEVGREALRAARYLREAARRREATPGLVEKVVGFLTRLERQPGLRFAP